MSIAAASVVNSVEAFRDNVFLVRCHLSHPDGPYPFVITCPDGKLLWGLRLTEAAHQEPPVLALPEIVADRVVLKHAGGEIEELIC